MISAVIAATFFVVLDSEKSRDPTYSSQDEMQAADASTDSSQQRVQQSASTDASVNRVKHEPKPAVVDSAKHAIDHADNIGAASVYDIVFDDNDPYSPLSLVHTLFLAEQRNESWASAMEGGIRGSIVWTEVTSSITVEQVECRFTICEVSGYMPDDMIGLQTDPRDVFSDEFGVGWWHGDYTMVLRQHTYDDEGINRFLIIIANRGVIENIPIPDRPK